MKTTDIIIPLKVNPYFLSNNAEHVMNQLQVKLLSHAGSDEGPVQMC